MSSSSVSMTKPHSGKVTKPKPRSGKVTKPEAIKPKRETFRDSFTVEGPVTIEADFMRCEIGAGDKTCFRTKPGGEIVIERDAPGHIRG